MRNVARQDVQARPLVGIYLCTAVIAIVLASRARSYACLFSASIVISCFAEQDRWLSMVKLPVSNSALLYDNN